MNMKTVESNDDICHDAYIKKQENVLSLQQ